MSDEEKGYRRVPVETTGVFVADAAKLDEGPWVPEWEPSVTVLEVAAETSPTAKAIVDRAKGMGEQWLNAELLLVALCEEIDDLKAALRRGLG